MRLFEDATARRRTALRLALLVAVLVGGAVALRRYAPFLLDSAWIRAAVAGLGPYAAPAFVVVQAAQVVLALSVAVYAARDRIPSVE